MRQRLFFAVYDSIQNNINGLAIAKIIKFIKLKVDSHKTYQFRIRGHIYEISVKLPKNHE